MDRESLTDVQTDTIGAIKHYLDVYHMPPTYAELAKMFGIRPNAVRDRLLILVRKGHLELIPNIARGIVLL
jgi:predicted ArsR family transcriptional regulator